MTSHRNDLPPPSAPNYGQRVRETLMTYLGKQGNPLDRGLTLRDLIESGFAKLPSGWKPGSDSVPLKPGDAVQPGDEPDLTPPPTPTGFAVSAGISHVFIEHDNPVFLQGHGYLRTHVYGAKVQAEQPLPVFADAVEVGQFSGSVWAMPSDPATTWRLWIKWESTDGVLSPDPAGGTNGLEAVTGQDVGLLLEALTGQITEGALYKDLGDRIDLIDGPDTLTGSVAARIKTEQTARQSADTANATLIQQVQARLDTGDYAAVKTESSATASKVTGLEAKYTVKVDVNGYVSGFGLASTANNATPTSEFAVRADKFYIANPAGPGIAPAMPFIVQTTATTINGVSVPVGVYMSDAFIRNGTITNAKIANAAIDDAKIANLSANKIKAGSIDTGEYIQSTNYVAGSTGWRINGNGSAEFGAASIRGQLTASQIDSRGLTIKDASGNVILGSGTALSTSYISGLGSLATQSSVTTAQVSGLGTLATQNSVSTSQVSGLGTLATQNSVSTSQVSGLGSLATQNDVFIGSNVRIWNGSSYTVLNTGDFVNSLSKITSSNISTFIASAAIGNAYIGNLDAAKITTGALATNRLQIGNNSGSSRIQMFDDRIEVWNGGVLRVKIGNLA